MSDEPGNVEKVTPFSEGPYIQAACFCEMVIEDKSGVLSLIRIVETLTHNERGPEPPEEMPPMMYPVKLVLMMKSGMAKGRSTIKIIPEEPDGSTKEPIYLTVFFEGEERGANIIIDLRYTYKMEGLYWFNIYLEDHKLTALPIRVKYNRMVIGSSN